MLSERDLNLVALASYERIKAALRTITVDEMRSRWSMASSTLPKSALASVLSKLGYSATGSKTDLSAKLLDNLTSIKISFDQTARI